MFKESSSTPSGLTEHRRQLDSIAEVIQFAKNIDDSQPSVRQLCSSTQEDSFNFTHTRTLREAINLCENGWPEGRQKIKDALSDLEEDGVANLGSQIKYYFDVAGDEPDVDRYLAGEPENMVDYFIKPNTKGRNVKLVVNAAQHASMDASIMTRRGIAIAAALETVVTAGFGVELEIAERAISYGSMAIEYRIPVVKAGEYLNLDSVAFALVHPSFLRRMIFALNESEPNDIRDEMGFWEHGGYGMPADPELRPSEDTAIVVSKNEGLLGSDHQIPVYAAELAKKLIVTTEGDDNE